MCKKMGEDAMSAIKEKYLNNKSFREPIDPPVEPTDDDYDQLPTDEPSDELMQADYEEAEYLADCEADR